MGTLVESSGALRIARKAQDVFDNLKTDVISAMSPGFQIWFKLFSIMGMTKPPYGKLPMKTG